MSFRREKFVPLGGPDGGDGGRGGHVLIRADAGTNTLNRYRQRRIVRAQKGQPGATNNRHGRDGGDLVLEVPVGTVVSRLDAARSVMEVVADLRAAGAVVRLARGGRGGKGNARFRSATNRAPRVAQRGEAGESLRVQLELHLIADVGLVGLPNAGKSTLLRTLTAARPRVAAYPFTTLEPNLGVGAVGWDEFVLADLPGLVEGAAGGAGLGHEFLRHAARTRLLIHIVDGARPDPLADHDLINSELGAYSAALAGRPQVVVINKLDLPEVSERRAALDQRFRERGIEPRFISAAAADGTEALAGRCLSLLNDLPAPPPERREEVLRPEPEPGRYWVAQEDTAFRVRGAQVERYVAMFDMDEEEARAAAYRWLTRRGVVAALRRRGIQPGDTVRVGEAEWQWDA